MTIDFSYVHNELSEDQSQALQSAITKACLDSIVQYLTEVADTMVANNITALNEPTIRAMTAELKNKTAQ